MKSIRLSYIKNILIPCAILSIVTGISTGVVIFLFKIAANGVTSLSNFILSLVKNNPTYIPILLVGAAVLGLISSFASDLLGISKGGGIPTSIAILRGLIEFRWVRSLFVVFGSALVSFFGGMPLGTEGPSVQMGTAIGRGTVRILAKKNPAWDRYIMTGGSCAGFAAATGAPLTGIFFAFEEAHRRFSPMIFLSAASAVISSCITINALDLLTSSSHPFLPFNISESLPLRYLWVPIIVGILCGVASIIFTKAYTSIGNFIRTKICKIPNLIKMPLLFVLVAIIGLLIPKITGSGHSIINELVYGDGIWYMLLLILLVRAILLITANNLGVTGGLFIPSLTFGAIIGSLCAKALVSLELLPVKYFPIIVVIGIVSFLSGSARTPITAVTFALEALCGLTNIIPVIIGATLSYAIIEMVAIPSFNDSVMESKVHTYNNGKPLQLIDTSFTVSADAFVIGKEIRDILWPPTCVITSVRKSPNNEMPVNLIGEGDILHLHYRTTDPTETAEKLEALIGKQSDTLSSESHTVSPSHIVPEN